jgi:hypothetical protein
MLNTKTASSALPIKAGIPSPEIRRGTQYASAAHLFLWGFCMVLQLRPITDLMGWLLKGSR